MEEEKVQKRKKRDGNGTKKDKKRGEEIGTRR